MAIAVILLIVTVVLIIMFLPILIMNIVMLMPICMVLFIGTPIFYPGTTMWELMEKIRCSGDPVVVMGLIRPFVPWLLVVVYIFYVVGIPSLTFMYLRWIGFYRRIPNAWVNRGE